MPNYIDKHKFHEELRVCKKKGALSKKAIEYFELLAREVSKNYYFNHDEDRKDSRQQAMQDCWLYWKNFKESNVVQKSFTYNFQPKEKIMVNIKNDRTYTFTATNKEPRQDEFMIEETINQSLKNLVSVINVYRDVAMVAFLDTIKKKLTVMDIKNGEDLTIKSTLTLMRYPENAIVNNNTEMIVEEIKFTNPPNAFCYFTSMVNNSILKSLNKLYPKVHKHSNRISIHSSSNQARFFNI